MSSTLATANHITFEHCEFKIYADGDNNFINPVNQIDRNNETISSLDKRVKLLEEEIKKAKETLSTLVKKNDDSDSDLPSRKITF